jgi:hypothetical protein
MPFIKSSYLRLAILAVPDVIRHLSGKARFLAYTPTAYKTYDYMLKQIEGLVRGVYNGNIGGNFIDLMANIISGQLTQAYNQAWIDEEGQGDFPDYLSASRDNMILRQYDYVDQYYRDVVDARVDQTPIDPLLARAGLWALRYTEAYNEAVRLITVDNGGNMIWLEGDTEKKCNTCLALDGIVARAKEWDTLGIRPQHAPNKKLDCEGWRCGCSLVPTDKRRSPGAYGRLEAIVAGI